MKRSFIFLKRNLKEIMYDPILYIFSISFPIAMIILFAIINHYSNATIFKMKDLIPGILVFSYSFIMLSLTLTISKDIKSNFLKRLYISPMKTKDFVIGYFITFFIIGLIINIIVILVGYFVSLITKEGYFSFSSSLLLMLIELPSLLFSIFIGIFISCVGNEKSSPTITSIFISLSSILSGCYMPIETMGDFKTFCRCLPFYPSVYIGRLITNSNSFNLEAYINLITIFIYLIVSVFLGLFFFNKQKYKSN